MAQWQRDTIATKIAEHLEELEASGVTTGTEVFVRFTPEFQKEYGVAPVGTVHQYIDEETGKEVWHYKAGPIVYNTSEKPLDYDIPSLRSWIEKFKEGEDPGSLYDLIPDKINPKLGKTPEARSVGTQNVIEKWIFSRINKVTLVDPSTGTLWRACTSGVHVNVVMTSTDEEWERQIRETFEREFAERRLRLEFGKKCKESLVYHGSNGFKRQISTANSFCLEPNPFSVDLRKEQSIIELAEMGYNVTYDRKKTRRTYYFEDFPSHIRIDPVSLYDQMHVTGDSYFLAMHFDPRVWGLKVTGEDHTSLATVYSLERYPQTSEREYKGWKWQVHEGVVYDVNLQSTYMSKYQWMRRNKPEGLSLPKLVKGYGRWVIHPYASSPRRASFTQREGSWIIDDYRMYNRECPDDATLYDIKAAVFVPGDFTGAVVTPLEQYGTWHPVDTFVRQGDPRFYVKLQKKGYYFSSVSVMQSWVLFILHHEQISIPSQINSILGIGVEEVPVTNDFMEEGLDTCDRPKLQTYDRIFMHLTEGPRTESDMKILFSDRPWSDAKKLLFKMPGINIMGDSYTIDPVVYDYDILDEGLFGIGSQETLKRYLLMGESFSDLIGRDVTDRLRDAKKWGYTPEVEEVYEDTGQIVRRFCYTDSSE